MYALCNLHELVFSRIERGAPFFLPTLARLVFAGVLLVYFWTAAGLKLAGPFSLNFGAYAQIFPRKLDAVGFDISGFSLLDRLIIFGGTYAEYVLPALIVLGLFTRLAALGMIGFVLVQSWVDIMGHGADAATIGAWFDKDSAALILDQRAFWMFVLLYLVFRGAGPLSLDRLFLERPRRLEFN